MWNRTTVEYFLITCFCLTVICTANAQETQHKAIQLSEMFIGDTIPAGLPMKAMINYPDSRAKFSDFRGKWLILDFWATHCQACINAMPEFYRLQQKFRDELNIVLVTNEDPLKVKSLLARSPVAKGTSFSFVVKDTILHQLFPHRYIPHEIWIDPEGVVRAVTDGDMVNEQNIQGMIAWQLTSLPIKKDYFETENAAKNEHDYTLFKTQLSRIKDVNSGSYGVKNDSTTGDFWYNQLPYRFDARGNNAISLIYMSYMMALEGYGSTNVNRKRIDFEIKDTALYDQYAKILVEKDRPSPHAKHFPYLHWKDAKEYADEMRYDYEFQVPAGMPDGQFFALVRQDLNRYFPIKSRVENRKKPCWVITAASTATETIRAKNKDVRYRFILSGDSLGVVNLPFHVFMRDFHCFKDTPPLVNETGIDTDMMVDIGLHLSDFPGYDPRQGLVVNNPLHFETVKRELNKYGMDIKEEKRWVDILVIYDE